MERAAAELWGAWRGDCFSALFQGFAGPAPARQGDLSARRGAAVVPAGGAGRGRDLRRYRPVRREEARASAPVPAVSRRHALARSPRRHLRDARCRGIPALLRRLGCGADRRAGGRDRHRRQDAAPLRPEEGRQGADPHGLRLRGAPAPRARPGQGGGEVQRDRRHPQAARHDGHRRRHRDHRRDGLPARHRPEDPRQEGRLRPRPERQPGHAARRCRALRRRAEGQRLQGHHDQPRTRRSMAITAASRPAPHRHP